MTFSINKLHEVARSRDSGQRRELLGAVAEMFLAGDADKSAREAALFSDIFLRTVDELDMDGRREVTLRLAESTGTPKAVAIHLAREEGAVADPMLRLSPVLEEQDLVEIAQEMSNEHLVSISQRESLSENVTDVLIDRGDRTVMRTITANDGARISKSGYETIASKAGDDEIVQGNLAGRLDVPEDVLRRVLPKMSGDVAQRIRTAFASAVDKQTMGSAVAKAEAAFSTAKLESSRGRVASLVVAKEVQDEKRHIDDAIREFATADRFYELVTVIGRLVDLPDNMVGDLLFKAENAPFVIVCRALGISRSAFLAFSDLRCRRLKLPSSHGNHAVAEFDAISEELAQRFVRFVKLRMAV